MALIMKQITTFLKLLLVLTLSSYSISNAIASDEKPIQHIKLEDIKSADKAQEVFIADSIALKSKTNLTPEALNEIHVITYSLEKSIAYYAQSSKGEMQDLAKNIAVIVENIHINSENNRIEETQKYLTQYFEIANQFKTFL